MNPSEATLRRTFHWEMARAPSAGVLETAATTFLLLIAVRVYGAEDWVKGLVAGLSRAGLMASFLVVPLLHRWPLTLPGLASRMHLLASGGFFAAAAFSSVLGGYVFGNGLAMLALMALLPLLTQIYRSNYPEEQRGSLFARTIVVKTLATIAFGWAAGKWLDWYPQHFTWVLLVFAVASWWGAYCMGKVPAPVLPRREKVRLWSAFAWVRRDAPFRRLLISWMFMGFANLMMLALLVDYLANERHGWALSNAQVALISVVIPSGVHLFFIRLWGRWFDRWNFYFLRAAINGVFVLAMGVTFFAPHFAVLVLGALFYGVAWSGGEIAWSLWVTKLAAHDHVADYMSVHTFLTEIRGFVAPLVGYALLGVVGIGWLAATSMVLIAISTAIFGPDIRLAQARRRGKVLIADIGE